MTPRSPFLLAPAALAAVVLASCGRDRATESGEPEPATGSGSTAALPSGETESAAAEVEAPCFALYPELLDAGLLGPVVLDPPIADRLRALERDAGELPVAADPERLAAVLAFARDLPAHGLDPGAVPEEHVGEVASLLETIAAAADPTCDARPESVHADHAVARLFLGMARAFGAAEPLPPESETAARLRLLDALATWDDPAALLATLPPPMSAYHRLAGWLADYRAIEARGGFTVVDPAVLAARPGKRHADLPSLRQRLEEEDPAAEDGAARDVWDETLTEALRRAREAYQLEPAKTPARLLDRALLDALAVPVATRIAQVRTNLERLRRSPARNHPYLVWLDLPDFHGDVWDGPERLLRFKIVIGSRSREGGRWVNATPTLSSAIHTVVYNPYWNVPKRILEEELFEDARKWEAEAAASAAALKLLPPGAAPPPPTPAASDDPYAVLGSAFWKAKGYEVMDAEVEGGAWVRRRPGPGNALGKVKLQFENRDAVYLHDTPQKDKFAPARRTFSHGCMRVEKPLELAELLLRRDGTWADAEAARVFEHRTETPIPLRRKVPIVIDYVTVRVDDEGRVHFLSDPYRRDPEVDVAGGAE